MNQLRTALARLAAPALVIGLLAGCAAAPTTPMGLTDVIARPAEKSLLSGMRAYDDGQYADAERHLGEALRMGLGSPRDAAAAHKLLAFIYCTSQRTEPCEAAFRAARAADPKFELSRAEAGHPSWGPIYKRVLP